MEPDPGVLAVALATLDHATPVTTPSPAAAAALGAAGLDARHLPEDAWPDGTLEALALVTDELSTAGDHAEGLVDAAARALRPGGLLLASAHAALRCDATATRTFSAGQLEQALSQRGFVVELVAAPGAAARVRGSGPVYDPERDRLPGLLDAAARVVVAGRSPRGGAARSAVFFDTLPRKVVAATALCRDDAGRLLVVFDAFRGHWAIPGGVVDADENPRLAAERETWEEAGVRVRAGAVLGVFAASYPDRVVLVYAATPVDPLAAAHPAPVHHHEVSEARWLPLDDALALINPRTRAQIQRSLTEPGGTWTH